jgi:hypothetical protein
MPFTIDLLFRVGFFVVCFFLPRPFCALLSKLSAFDDTSELCFFVVDSPFPRLAFFGSSGNDLFNTDLSKLLIDDNALGCLVRTAFLAAGFFEAFLPRDATFLASSEGLFAFDDVPEHSLFFFGLPHLAFFGCSILVFKDEADSSELLVDSNDIRHLLHLAGLTLNLSSRSSNNWRPPCRKCRQTWNHST